MNFTKFVDTDARGGLTRSGPLVLSGVRILALGPPTPQTADTNLGTGQPALYSTVTLSVTVAQAETLALAEESGQVTLLAIGITGK